MMANMQNKGALSAIFGGLSGGVFFFGLAIAIVSGHFLPVFFATLAFTSLVGSLASLNAQGIYGGFQGFVFLMGLAILALTGWCSSSMVSGDLRRFSPGHPSLSWPGGPRARSGCKALAGSRRWS